MLKQITKNSEIVSVCISENLNKKFWKYQNAKLFNKIIKEDKRFRKSIFDEIPSFNKFVIGKEIEFGKPREEFNVLEDAAARKEYYEKYVNVGRQ